MDRAVNGQIASYLIGHKKAAHRMAVVLLVALLVIVATAASFSRPAETLEVDQDPEFAAAQYASDDEAAEAAATQHAYELELLEQQAAEQAAAEQAAAEEAARIAAEQAAAEEAARQAAEQAAAEEAARVAQEQAAQKAASQQIEAESENLASEQTQQTVTDDQSENSYTNITDQETSSTAQTNDATGYETSTESAPVDASAGIAYPRTYALWLDANGAVITNGQEQLEYTDLDPANPFQLPAAASFMERDGFVFAGWRAVRYADDGVSELKSDILPDEARITEYTWYSDNDLDGADEQHFLNDWLLEADADSNYEGGAVLHALWWPTVSFDVSEQVADAETLDAYLAQLPKGSVQDADYADGQITLLAVENKLALPEGAWAEKDADTTYDGGVEYDFWQPAALAPVVEDGDPAEADEPADEAAFDEEGEGEAVADDEPAEEAAPDDASEAETPVADEAPAEEEVAAEEDPAPRAKAAVQPAAAVLATTTTSSISVSIDLGEEKSIKDKDLHANGGTGTWAYVGDAADYVLLAPDDSNPYEASVLGIKTGTAKVTYTSSKGVTTFTIKVSSQTDKDWDWGVVNGGTITIDKVGGTATADISSAIASKSGFKFSEIKSWDPKKSGSTTVAYVSSSSKTGKTATIKAVNQGTTYVMAEVLDSKEDKLLVYFTVKVAETQPATLAANPTDVTIPLNSTTTSTLTLTGCTVTGKHVVSSNTNIVTASYNATTKKVTLRGVAPGTATVTITGTPDASHSGTPSAQITVRVTAKGTMTAQPASINVVAGETQDTLLTLDHCAVANVRTSNAGVATARYDSATGKIVVTGVAEGTANITVSGKGTAPYDDPNQLVIPVTVVRPGASSITPSPTEVETVVGDSQTVTLSLSGCTTSADEVVWHDGEGSTGVATVAYDEATHVITVTGAAEGTGYIEVRGTHEKGYADPAAVTIPVTVSLAPSSIRPATNEVTVRHGATTAVSVTLAGCTVDDASAQIVGADNDIASYEWIAPEDGSNIGTLVITGEKVGDTTVTMSGTATAGHATPDPQTITVRVIDRAESSIAADTTEVTVDAGSAADVTLTLSDCVTSADQIVCADPSIASLNFVPADPADPDSHPVVTVTGVAPGTTSFTISGTGDAGFNDPEPLTVSVVVNEVLLPSSISAEPTAVSLEVGASATATLVLDGCTVGAAQVTTSDESVATVSYNETTGRITVSAIKEGTAQITVEGTPEAGHTAPTAVVIPVTVGGTESSIAAQPTVLKVAASGSNTSATSTLSFTNCTYTSITVADSSIATAAYAPLRNGEGGTVTVTGKKGGTTYITVKGHGTGSASDPEDLVIPVYVSSLGLSPTSATIEINDTAAVVVSLEHATTSTAQVTSSNPGVATATYNAKDNTIVVTGLAEGSATFTVKASGENGVPDPADVTFKVTVKPTGYNGGVNTSAPYVVAPGKSIVTSDDVSHTLDDWQIVGRKYDGATASTYEYASDGSFRVKKQVIPTDTENEFLVYLDVEPQVTIETTIESVFDFEANAIWYNNSHNSYTEGTNDLGIDPWTCTGEQFKKALSGGGANPTRLVGTWDASRTANNSAHPNGKTYHITQITIGSRIIPLSGYITLPTESNGSVYIFFHDPGKHVLKLPTNTLTTNGTGWTLPINLEGLTEEELIKKIVEYSSKYSSSTTVTQVGIPSEVRDVMGDYITYVQDVRKTAGTNASYTSSSKTLLWNGFKQISNLPSTKSSYAEGPAGTAGAGKLYYEYGYELIYRVRLDTAKSGFTAGTAYKTNASTALYQGSTQKTTFTSPTVKGTLYDLRIKKVDQFGNPVSGAAFKLTGASQWGASINRTATYTGSDGIYTIVGVPTSGSAPYTVSETTVPDGYAKADDVKVSFNVTASPNLYAASVLDATHTMLKANTFGRADRFVMVDMKDVDSGDFAITKAFDATHADPDASADMNNFTMRVTVTDADGRPVEEWAGTYVVETTTGATTAESTFELGSAGTGTVSLKAGQTATIKGLPAGARVSVEETRFDRNAMRATDYAASYAYADGDGAALSAAPVAITKDKTSSVVVTNTRLGSVLIYKSFDADQKNLAKSMYGDGVTFTFDVHVDGLVGDVAYDENLGTTKTATFDADGNATITLGIDDFATFTGLPAGAYVTVSERTTGADGHDGAFVASYGVTRGGAVEAVDPSTANQLRVRRVMAANGTFMASSTADVDVENSMVTGTFQLEKVLSAGNTPDETSFVFELAATYTDAGGATKAFDGTASYAKTVSAERQSATGTSAAVTGFAFDASGKATVSLRAGEKLVVTGLPAGVSITATETYAGTAALAESAYIASYAAATGTSGSTVAPEPTGAGGSATVVPGGVSVVRVTNTPATHRMQLVKVDESGAPISAPARFALYKAEDVTVGQAVGAGGEGYTVAEGAVPVASGESTSASRGVVFKDDVPYGDYLLIETAAPAGYEKLSHPVTVTVGHDGVTCSYEESGEAGVTSAADPDDAGTTLYTLSVADRRASQRVKIVKTDETGTATLVGASFTLYAADQVEPSSGADGAYAPKSGATQVSGVVASTAGDGVIFDGSLVSGTYYLDEVAAPAGYNRYPTQMAINVQSGTVTITPTGGKLLAIPVDSADNALSSADDAGFDHYLVTVPNTTGAALPMTGGEGVAPYTAAGIALIAFSLIGALARIRRRARGGAEGRVPL